MQITITDKAADHIKALLAKAPEGTLGLRLNIKTTGCSGNSYEMKYVEEDDETSGDDYMQSNGTGLYVPKIYSWMISGTEIDFITDDLGSSRFEFTNPNETGRCGCGESFTVERSKGHGE